MPTPTHKGKFNNGNKKRSNVSPFHKKDNKNMKRQKEGIPNLILRLGFIILFYAFQLLFYLKAAWSYLKNRWAEFKIGLIYYADLAFLSCPMLPMRPFVGFDEYIGDINRRKLPLHVGISFQRLLPVQPNPEDIDGLMHQVALFVTWLMELGICQLSIHDATSLFSSHKKQFLMALETEWTLQQSRIAHREHIFKYVPSEFACDFIRLERTRTGKKLASLGNVSCMDIRIYPSEYGKQEIVNLALWLQKISKTWQSNDEKGQMQKRDWLAKNITQLQKGDVELLKGQAISDPDLVIVLGQNWASTGSCLSGFPLLQTGTCEIIHDPSSPFTNLKQLFSKFFASRLDIEFIGFFSLLRLLEQFSLSEQRYGV